MSDHGSAHPLQLQFPRTSRTSPAGHVLHPTRQDLVDGHVFPNPDFPRRNDRPVASSGLSEPGGVRQLQAAVRGSGGGRPGSSLVTIPRPKIHRHGTRRKPGQVPPLQGETRNETKIKSYKST